VHSKIRCSPPLSHHNRSDLLLPVYAPHVQITSGHAFTSASVLPDLLDSLVLPPQRSFLRRWCHDASCSPCADENGSTEKLSSGLHLYTVSATARCCPRWSRPALDRMVLKTPAAAAGMISSNGSMRGEYAPWRPLTILQVKGHILNNNSSKHHCRMLSSLSLLLTSRAGCHRLSKHWRNLMMLVGTCKDGLSQAATKLGPVIINSLR
jgi:hypothetical protein